MSTLVLFNSLKIIDKAKESAMYKPKSSDRITTLFYVSREV